MSKNVFTIYARKTVIALKSGLYNVIETMGKIEKCLRSFAVQLAIRQRIERCEHDEEKI